MESIEEGDPQSFQNIKISMEIEQPETYEKILIWFIKINLGKSLRVEIEGPEYADFYLGQALDHWDEQNHKYFR